MKKLSLSIFLFIFIFLAGCSNSQNNTDIPSDIEFDATITPTTTPTPTPTITPTPIIPLLNLDDFDESIAASMEKFNPVPLTEMNNYQINNDKQLKIKGVSDTSYIGITDVYILDFFNNKEGMLIYTTEEIADFIYEFAKYLQIEVIVEFEENVIYFDEITKFYKLINFRFVAPDGNIIETLDYNELRNKIIEYDLVKEVGNHEETLMITDILSYKISCINANGIERDIYYDSNKVDVFMLEIGKTYSINYESTYDEKWKNYEYNLISSPIITESLNLNINDYIRQDKTIPINEMPKNFETTNGERILTLDNYVTSYSWYYWKLWQSNLQLYANRTLCELAEIVDNIYDLKVIAKDGYIVNARFVDKNNNLIDSIQYEDVINKLKEDKFLFIEEKEEVMQYKDNFFERIEAIDNQGNYKEFTYLEDFMLYKLKKEQYYLFKYKEIKRLKDGEYETELLLEDVFIR